MKLRSVIRTSIFAGLLLTYTFVSFRILTALQQSNERDSRQFGYDDVFGGGGEEVDSEQEDRGQGLFDSQAEDAGLSNKKQRRNPFPKPFVHTTDYIPSIVYMVWCGRRWFEFHNYLSVKSVIRTLHPDKIVFFYDALPVLDRWIYNTWFDELKTEYPFFHFREVTAAEGACSAHAKPNLNFIRQKIMFGNGGIYVNEHTIIDQFNEELWTADIVDAIDNTTGMGFLAIKGGLATDALVNNNNNNNAKSKVYRLRCGSRDYYNAAYQKQVCVNVPEVFYPKDIWELKEAFGRLARRVFYGDGHIRPVLSSNRTLIPNIAHIVWIGGGEMDYLFYLCVLSLLHVARAEAVYIYGEAPPRGALWESVKTEPRLHCVYRDASKTVFGTTVDVISHVTDIWRGDFMVKYGGIYVDTDTIFVRPLDDVIRTYDAVGTYDWTYWNHPFPDTINFGVAIGKQGAPFWLRFQESMQWFIDSDWSWNGLRQPYRIKERHPELIRIDPHLQVTCFEYKCHPTWWPNYHNEQIHHLNSPSISNWRTDAYAFHWTLPTPPELMSEQALLASNTMFAEIGKHVLRMANRLQGA